MSLYSSDVDSSSHATQSEVLLNINEAKWFNCGSCGSKASKLDVEVESVGPTFSDGSCFFLGDDVEAFGVAIITSYVAKPFYYY